MSSSQSESDIIVIKSEELDNNIVTTSDNPREDFYNHYQQKQSKGIKRSNWSHKETEYVVQVLEKYGMPSRTNLWKFCYIIVNSLKDRGFSRSEEQAQIKIKHLRAMYNRVVHKTLKEHEFPFFKRMKTLIHAQISKLKENEVAQNYTIEEHSKLDMEDNSISLNETAENDTCYKKNRQIWTNKEIYLLLKFIEENDIVTGKQLRKLSSKVVNYLSSYGYNRSPTQILIRWKNTKALYWATFRKRSEFPEKECGFFYRLHAILNSDNSIYPPSSPAATKTVYDDEDMNFDHFPGTFNNIDIKKPLNNFQFSKIARFKKDNFIHIENSTSERFISHQNNSSNQFPVYDTCAETFANNDGIIKNPCPTVKHDKSIVHNNSTFCSTLDPIDHYCISLAHSIKKLDARKQAKLKIEIQRLMYKAEFDSNF